MMRQYDGDGLVERTVYASVPARVDYELTELGRTLLVPLIALDEWAYAHRDDIRAARERNDTPTVGAMTDASRLAAPDHGSRQGS